VQPCHESVATRFLLKKAVVLRQLWWSNVHIPLYEHQTNADTAMKAYTSLPTVHSACLLTSVRIEHSLVC
jgi:hypothetical protein